jgi:tetratricopeptide (TPR) repeat protein
MMHRFSIFLALSLIMPAVAVAQPDGKSTPAQAAAQATTSADSLVRIGDRMRATGDVAAALGFYQRALEIDPNNVSALRAAGQMLADGGAAAASDSYWQQLLTLTPTDPMALLGRARALNAQMRPEEALRQLDALKPADAKTSAALAERGLALDLSGDPQAAQMAYGDALTAAGTADADLRIKLALSFALSKDYRTANQLLQQMVNVPGMADKVRGALGLAYALGGDAEAAAQIATLGKPPEEAKALLPFYRRLPQLGVRQQAAAVHLGILDLGTPLPTQTNAAPAVAAPEPVVAESPPPAAGSWVQLGAFSSREQAQEQWRIVQRNAADLIGKLSGGASRIAGFERLLVGPLTAEAATTLATQLKARGISAFTRTEALVVTPLN